MKGAPLSLLALLLAQAGCLAADPVLRVIRSDDGGRSRLNNGNFETAQAAAPAFWSSAPQGCRLDQGGGRAGSRALFCDSPSPKGWFGASQTLVLGQTQPVPLVVSGWSKAQQVSGGADSDYSLYADLVYADGTPLWGQTAVFRAGSHDWQRAQIVITPEKPVKSITLYCLFRNHAGKVWFDDVSLQELNAPAGAVFFQGAPVALTNLAPVPIDSLPPSRPPPGFFMARDVAANSDFFPFQGADCPELGLRLKLSRSQDLSVGDGYLVNLRTGDRAITLVYVLPVDATGCRWGDDIRRSRVIAGQGDFANLVSVRCGATASMSLYPVGAIWGQSNGLALTIDMACPAQYRIGYHAGLKALYLAYDFGLVPESQQFPGAAPFRFRCDSFHPRWGGRSAWNLLHARWREYFQVRAKEQGLWMPFTDVSTVQGWQDFRFKFHEGDNNVPWDDEHGVLSFRYTEPMTWWMPMKKDLPRTQAEALRARDLMAQAKEASGRRMAEVTLAAAMFDERGQPSLQFHDTPWCNGAVWSLNPNPFLPSPAGMPNGASVYWSDQIKERLYGPKAKGRLDGEYLDSLEGYVTAELNFRRDHFRYTTVPLTFSTDSHQPALFKGLAVFEFTKWLGEDVHRMGKLMFANGVPYRFSFLCPWLDVLGTETDWLQNGKYRPASLAQMDLWRSMSGAKPYLLLMNTDYDRFTPDLVEKYFQRSLFYGMWPGFFSHNAADNPYWGNPKWYDRDRPLFKKYLPLIAQVAQAGWQPVPMATCDNDRILVERFGESVDRGMFLTLYNDTAQPQQGRLSVERKDPDPETNTPHLSGPSEPFEFAELPGNRVLGPGENPLAVSLEPQQARVLHLRKPPLKK